MTSVRKVVTAVFDHTLNLFNRLAGVILIFMMVSITYEVVMRYFFNQGVPWPLEFSKYGLLWITFLGAAWLLREDRHVRMDLVITRLKPKTRAAVNTITSFIGVIIFSILTWFAIAITQNLIQTGYYMASIMETPKGFIAVIIPVGSFLLLIQSIRMTLGYLGTWRAGDKAQN